MGVGVRTASNCAKWVLDGCAGAGAAVGALHSGSSGCAATRSVVSSSCSCGGTISALRGALSQTRLRGYRVLITVDLLCQHKAGSPGNHAVFAPM